MKTIFFDLRSLFNNTFSGVQEYTFHLLNNLLEIDQKNKYLLFSSGTRQESAKANSKLKEWELVMFSQLLQHSNTELKHITLPNKLLNFSINFLKFPSLNQFIKQKIDLFFFPNLMFISLSKDIPYIIVLHDLSFEVDQSFFSRQMRTWHRIINPQAKAKKAKTIITVSKNTKRDLINFYGIDKKQIQVIYPGLSLGANKTNPCSLQKIQKKYNLPPSFILYLGTLEPRKNIVGIIQAFEILKNSKKQSLSENLKLVIAGQCGWQCCKIYQTAKKSKFAQDIIFTGFIEEEDKPGLYKMAQVFIYPSLYEGFGFPPLEALACGTPSVISSHSSLPEIIGTAALAVDPYNVREIAEGISILLENKKAKQIILKNKDQVLNKYNWQRCAQKVLQVIEKNI